MHPARNTANELTLPTFEKKGGGVLQTNAVLLFHSLPIIGEEALGGGC